MEKGVKVWGILFGAMLLLVGCDKLNEPVRNRSGYDKMGTTSQVMTNNLSGGDQAGAGFDLPGAR